MKIRAIGTGAIFTHHRSSSYLVDGKILVDCPNGIVKTMREQRVDIQSIDACLITHFHADHIFDMPFLLLELGLRSQREKEFTILGPQGIEERVRFLFSLAYPEDVERVFAGAKPRFIEVHDGKSVAIDSYSIRAYVVSHGGCSAFGFVVHTGDKAAGFSGDSNDCDGIKSIVSESAISFLDASFVTDTETHMGVESFSRYLASYGDEKMLMPTHMSDAARAKLVAMGLDVPSDGDVFTV